MSGHRDPSDPITEPWQRATDLPGYVPMHACPERWPLARRLRDERDVQRAIVVLAATHKLPASRVLYRWLIAVGALRGEWAA